MPVAASPKPANTAALLLSFKLAAMVVLLTRHLNLGPDHTQQRSYCARRAVDLSLAIFNLFKREKLAYTSCACSVAKEQRPQRLVSASVLVLRLSITPLKAGIR